jgi:hypothetical protein
MGYGPITLPLRHGEIMEDEGFEPSTLDMQSRCATTAPNPQIKAPFED